MAQIGICCDLGFGIVYRETPSRVRAGSRAQSIVHERLTYIKCPAATSAEPGVSLGKLAARRDQWRRRSQLSSHSGITSSAWHSLISSVG
jgi:hypothetical protein